MDLFNSLQSETRAIKCIDMHTCGEPTRIIVQGYPQLTGETLLEKRKDAQLHHDGIRKRLMLEPRGHQGMYGAIIVQETELVQAGMADIGVLFCHTDGYSTMCGHATIALGRFLVDTRDKTLFPQRSTLQETDNIMKLRVHAPCGLPVICVPTKQGLSDPELEVSFSSVPCFASGIDVAVTIPTPLRWTEMERMGRNLIKVDVAYGGAFYGIVQVEELGFPGGLSSEAGPKVGHLARVVDVVKNQLARKSELFAHRESPDLEFLYGIIVVETLSDKQEIGLCFFGSGQLDRSPTGSGVCARVALSMERGDMKKGVWRRYDSPVSLQSEGHAFHGRAIDHAGGHIVEVKGKAFYTGVTTFILEREDTLGNGFTFQLP